MSKNINIDQAIEYNGYWYLPSSPEKRFQVFLHIAHAIKLQGFDYDITNVIK